MSDVCSTCDGKGLVPDGSAYPNPEPCPDCGPDDQRNPTEGVLATSQRCGHYYEGDPVLVRHPRPEVGDGRDVPVATTNPERTLLAALLAIDAEHVKAHDVPGCALCWPGDGSWPCTTRMETDAALDALRELDACRRALGDS